MRRNPCDHCGKKPWAAFWTLRPCALGRVIKIRLCQRCDATLNAMTLRFARHPKAAALIKKYRERT
jgi:formate dehydrogenase maturation protein FdhE